MNYFICKNKRDLLSFRFVASLDDRGRIVVPAYIRNRFNLKFNSNVILEFRGKYGRDSVMASIGACGAPRTGSNPVRGPNEKIWGDKL